MWLKEFFYFNKSDRRVLLVLGAALVILFGTIYVVGTSHTETSVTEADSLAVAPVPYDTVHRARGPYAYRHYPPRTYYVEGRRVVLSTFDPNTADSTQLLELGLQPWQVRNIYKYRAKGGVYRTPDDFGRLYGLTVKQFRELRPYIHISEEYQPASTLLPERQVRDTLKYPVKMAEGMVLSLNDADTTALRRVPGIGSALAQRIVRYREQLGGYYSVSQLLEIDNFPQSSLPFFSLGTPSLRRINLNRSSVAKLKAHPYISFIQARAIRDYINQKGAPLDSLGELSLSREFTPDQIARLRPYVEY